MGSFGLLRDGTSVRNPEHGLRADVQGTRHRRQPDRALDFHHHVPMDPQVPLEPSSRASSKQTHDRSGDTDRQRSRVRLPQQGDTFQ